MRQRHGHCQHDIAIGAHRLGSKEAVASQALVVTVAIMKIVLLLIGCLLTAWPVSAQRLPQVAQIVEGEIMQRNYPDALASLLQAGSESAQLALSDEPAFYRDFSDPKLLQHPILYCNYADISDWALGREARRQLKAFLDRGGFLYIDAGISASFLRDGNAVYGQSHSFAEWQVTPQLETLFRELYPESRFEPLPRSHPLFRAHYSGLPDPSNLPESVRDYVVHEKWPQGTFSLMGLYVNDRLAVVCSPIIAMGWGRNSLGQWTTNIGFRVRESADGLSERLSQAAYTGQRFETQREDGQFDVIYTQEAATPAWVQETDGHWRVFRYYHTNEINDFAHRFYTRLGTNIFVHALAQ